MKWKKNLFCRLWTRPTSELITDNNIRLGLNAKLSTSDLKSAYASAYSIASTKTNCEIPWSVECQAYNSKKVTQ